MSKYIITTMLATDPNITLNQAEEAEKMKEARNLLARRFGCDIEGEHLVNDNMNMATSIHLVELGVVVTIREVVSTPATC